MADPKEDKNNHENQAFTQGSTMDGKKPSAFTSIEETNVGDALAKGLTVNGINPAEKKPSVNIQRRVYNQHEFDEAHTGPRNRFHDKTLKKSFKKIGEKCKCSPQCTKKFIFSIFPFLSIMSNYSLKEDFVNDLISGLTVGIMQVPQGMAYALLANVPPVYGLYVSFIPPIIYFFFGTSRHINIGTFAVISLMVGNVVTGSGCESLTPTSAPTTAAPFTTEGVTGAWNGTVSTTTTKPGESAEEVACKIGVAVAVTFIGGLVQIGLGLLRLGFVTTYLSDPLTRGFTTGASMHVFTSQVKYIFGIKVARYSGILKLVYTYIDFFKNIAQTQWLAIVISVVCMVLLFVTKEFINPKVKPKIKMPIPMELFVVIIGTVASVYGKFRDDFNLEVVGNIEIGIPPPKFPPTSRLAEVWSDSLSIAIVAFAISVSMAKLFGKKHSYEVDANQELIAYGITNAVGSMFNCFMTAASLSRSLVQETVGGRTQVASLVSCVLILVTLYAAGPLFEQLPLCVLAAIIVIALKGMFMQFLDLKKLWFISKIDFLIWLVTFAATVLLDVDIGLIAGVVFSLLTVIYRNQRPYSCILGRVPHTDLYKDRNVYEGAQMIKGIKIFRFEASLFYANCEFFVTKLYQRVGVNPKNVKTQMDKLEKKRQKEIKKRENEEKKRKKKMEKGEMVDPVAAVDPETQENWQLDPIELEDVIIDCTTMGYIDSMGVHALSQVIHDFKNIGITVQLAGCKGSVREMLESAGFFEKIDKDQLFVTVHDAVLNALQKHPDLEDQLREDSLSLRTIMHSNSNLVRQISFNLQRERIHSETLPSNSSEGIWYDSVTRL